MRVKIVSVNSCRLSERNIVKHVKRYVNVENTWQGQPEKLSRYVYGIDRRKMW